MGDDRAELERLRARAYGRDADIASDPGALERLQFLEGRNAVTAAPDARASEPPAPELPASEPSASEEPLAEPSASGSTLAAPGRWWRRAWPIAAVAVGGVIAGVVAAQLLAPQSVASTETGAVLADTVRADPGLEWPEIFGGGEDDVRVWSYRGLTMASTDMFVYSPGSDECLVLMESEDVEPYIGPNADDGSGGWTFDGMQFNGCTAGAFPATVQFVVGAEAPTELRARFSVGTAVQIVLDGEFLRVYEHSD